MNTHLTYFSILFASWIIAFLYVVIHRKPLSKNGLYPLQLSILLSSIPFIIWDYIAFYRHHWDYNQNLITNIRLWGLPIEEFFFFWLVPQASLLIWVVMNKYPTKQELIEAALHHFKKQ